jgi:hypothetical protein
MIVKVFHIIHYHVQTIAGSSHLTSSGGMGRTI